MNHWLTPEEVYDVYQQDARDSLADDLFQKLGRDPSAQEIDDFVAERIADRIISIREAI